MTSGRRWCEIRKAEATLDAYKKYTAQDEGLRDEALHIGEATVRLKWHKGRILEGMEKQGPGEYKRLQGATVQPSYAELGIDVYHVFGVSFPTLGNSGIEQSALYLLSAPKTPQAERNDAIVKLYRDGYTQEAIGKLFGINQTQIGLIVGAKERTVKLVPGTKSVELTPKHERVLRKAPKHLQDKIAEVVLTREKTAKSESAQSEPSRKPPQCQSVSSLVLRSGYETCGDTFRRATIYLEVSMCSGGRRGCRLIERAKHVN